MAARGKRKYRCEECSHEQFVHWVEFNRATRPRCSKCGSVRLEVVSEYAKKARLNDLQRAIEHSDDRGDLVRTKRVSD